MPDELMGDPAEGGQVEPEVDTTQELDGAVEPPASEPPARAYVEVEDPDSHYVRVTVDGEEVEVPFREALQGYSRHADYSRKTAELAQQRQQAEYALRIQEALQVDPEATLQFLARQHLKMPEPRPEVPQFDDPLERQVWEANQRTAAIETRLAEQEADQQLNSTIGTLRSQFNANDDDIREVIQTAYQHGLGIEALPMIYKTMQFDRLQARVQASQAQRAVQAAEVARRQAAAASASQVISTGAGAPNGGLVNSLNSDNGNMSFLEAVEAALAQHGEPTFPG